MSIFSNELAPNLFKSYHDWYTGYFEKTGKWPEKSDRKEAYKYFYDFDPDTFDTNEDELIYIWKDGNENTIVEVHDKFLDVYLENGWEVYEW